MYMKGKYTEKSNDKSALVLYNVEKEQIMCKNVGIHVELLVISQIAPFVPLFPYPLCPTPNIKQKTVT